MVASLQQTALALKLVQTINPLAHTHGENKKNRTTGCTSSKYFPNFDLAPRGFLWTGLVSASVWTFLHLQQPRPIFHSNKPQVLVTGG